MKKSASMEGWRKKKTMAGEHVPGKVENSGPGTLGLEGHTWNETIREEKQRPGKKILDRLERETAGGKGSMETRSQSGNGGTNLGKRWRRRGGRNFTCPVVRAAGTYETNYMERQKVERRRMGPSPPRPLQKEKSLRKLHQPASG